MKEPCFSRVWRKSRAIRKAFIWEIRVHNILVHDGATLDMNLLNVYYDGLLLVEDGGQIINGTPQYIPEPGMLALGALGMLAVLARRGLKQQ